MPQCLARVTYEASKRYFADEKHYFYLEFQCENTVTDGHQMCQKCRFKNATRTQEARSFDHGAIGGEIPEKSHIYGGPWYLEAEKKYGKPKDLEESLRMVKEEQKETNGQVKKRRVKKSGGVVLATEHVLAQSVDMRGIRYTVSLEEPALVKGVRKFHFEETDGSIWKGEDIEVERGPDGYWLRIR